MDYSSTWLTWLWLGQVVTGDWSGDMIVRWLQEVRWLVMVRWYNRCDVLWLGSDLLIVKGWMTCWSGSLIMSGDLKMSGDLMVRWLVGQVMLLVMWLVMWQVWLVTKVCGGCGGQWPRGLGHCAWQWTLVLTLGASCPCQSTVIHVLLTIVALYYQSIAILSPWNLS